MRMPAEGQAWHLLHQPPQFVRQFAAQNGFPLRAAVAALALLRTPAAQLVMAHSMGVSRCTFTADIQCVCERAHASTLAGDWWRPVWRDRFVIASTCAMPEELRRLAERCPTIWDDAPLFIQRPGDGTQARYFSGKHRAHCLKGMCCTTHDGRVAYVPPVWFPGVRHSSAIQRVVDLAIAPALRTLPDGSKEGRLADMGFLSVLDFVVPFKKYRGVPLTHLQRLHNRRVNRLRWRVEKAFADTKRHRFFDVCAGK
eukprot:gene12214-9606_t